MPEAADSGRAGGGTWYSYAVIRIVPRVERGEFLNAGVILFARTLNFLDVRIHLDEGRLRALSPEIDVERVKGHLATFERIARGDTAGGEVASLDQSQRFHWLTSPRSTVIQTSAVHVGCSDDPAGELEGLMGELVL